MNDDPFGIHKKKDRSASNAAITSAGAVTAGTGLAAGGIPGAKPNENAVWNMKGGEGKGVKRAISTVRGAAPAAPATPGGILGFRYKVHAGGLYGFDREGERSCRCRQEGEAVLDY